MAKKSQKKLLVIHGPNLHMLGKRETSIYGKMTLATINAALKKSAAQYKLNISIEQSNTEGKIVEFITNSQYDFLIINPAAYTHTSVAIRDAILAANKPVIEVHISNIYKREEFRKKSLVSDVALGVITGLGMQSYLLAVEAAAIFLKTQK